jgi:superfamily II DNA or RNA helicase
MLRPLGGTDDEVTGIHSGLETVEPATFDLPTVSDLGDFHGARLLRDAVRLGFRSSAGPFRSFARLACEPRPYQLVPLLMALRQDPVRLLIADDVGIGKTIEACLVARELLDRAEVDRLAVLCPPHLAEQWQGELRDKFNILAELVLPGTVRRLEADLLGRSLFEANPFVVVSTDFIKSDRHRDEFIANCPELVIVDEAHTCAATAYGGTGRHQRHQLLKGLASRADRHLVLVTATPHSGKDEAFRSLLSLLDPDFAALPQDLGGEQNRRHRERLAGHLVQRRRDDIKRYLAADTPFPERKEREDTYTLTPDYQRLFEKALDFAQELVQDQTGSRLRQRIQWWSALALLRSISSSPAAAAETLRNRGQIDEGETEDTVDPVGRRSVLDAIDEDSTEGADVAPAGDPTRTATPEDEKTRRRLNDMAKQADALRGAKDPKLQAARKAISALVDEGFRPIVFCRFIPTAEYVAEELRRSLRGVEVAAVTGLVPPAEREARVAELAQSAKRVLVCTDCLSEGINLQEHFDAVFHYDLAWNPTRHEQREGRVDRYGQKSPEVRVITLHGADNPVDDVVIKVLVRKHQAIRRSLGISVPVPIDTEQAMATILQRGLLRKRRQLTLDFEPDAPDELQREWQAAADREKGSRALFAQHGISTEEVRGELEAARAAIGSGVDVARFVGDTVSAHGGVVRPGPTTRISLIGTPAALRDATLAEGDEVAARFELPVGDGEVLLHRTHPFVSGLASFLLDCALDPVLAPLARARRAGVVFSSAVDTRTTLLLLRLRFHITAHQRGPARELLAEEALTVGFRGSPDKPDWLAPEAAEALLLTVPDANAAVDIARVHLERLLDRAEALRPHLETLARERGRALETAHRRVRQAARQRAIRDDVAPKLPVDILGLYVYLPR